MIKKIIILLITTISLLSCQRNEVIKSHGISYLEKREKLITVNKTNKNDAIKYLGQPATKGMTDKNLWIYIERTQTQSNLKKLGKMKIFKNDVLVLEIDNYGILKKNREVPLDEERDQSQSPKILEENGQSRSGCIQEQLVKFREADPERAEVIEFILKGFSTEEIRLILGRSYGATREFMSQCRKKFRPFIEICNEIEE